MRAVTEPTLPGVVAAEPRASKPRTREDTVDAFLGDASVPVLPSPLRTRGRSPSRVAAGRKAQRAGAALERWLAGQHHLAVLEHLLAWMIHVPAGAGYRRRGKALTDTIHTELQWTAEACADFVGCLVGGRSVVVEAKSVEHGRLYRDAVAPQQARHLDATVKGGGVALLVVEFRDAAAKGRPARATIHAIPWAEVPWATRRKAESLTREDVARWVVGAQEVYLRRFARAAA